jgi:ferric-dicitrate binding protein FerR (iron transport regulator)
MDATEAKALLRRYLEGNASPGEIQLVEQWYQHLADGGEWNWAQGEKERLEVAIESRLLQQIQAEERPVRKMRTIRWVAAAVFVLLAGTASWLLFNRKKEPTDIVQRFRNDVAPGRNAAILTLAGGKAIVLDSATTGTIGKQGNATVANNNGRLIYTALHEKPGGLFYNTLTTPRGYQYQLVLPDGSKVWLNAASSITYPTAFAGKERKVVVRGEAYFEVATNKSLPFIVQEGDMTVQVLGTHFNINGYDDEAAMKTTLLEGAVKVLGGSSGSLLKPGQQAMLARNDGRMTVVNDANIDEVMAWKNGEFLFTEAPIESIMRQVARWYDVDVVYDTPVSGHFVADIPRNVPLSRLLKLLELTDQVHFKIERKKITVIR